MKLHNLLILFVCVILVVSSTYQTVNSENMNTRESKYSTSNKETNEKFLLSINVSGHKFLASLLNNDATKKLISILSDKCQEYRASNYGSFEKIVYLDVKLPTNDHHVKTNPGDIMLYQGDKLVIFYGSNSWSYTAIGRIIDSSQDNLEAALNNKDSKVILSLAKK